MKALWIRVEAHAKDSVKVAQLAEQLGLDPIHALGLYVALGGAIAEHTDAGHIADVPNATLETWAGWKGKRGEFARAVREILQDGDGNYDEWNDSMGKLVERRARDRDRKEREKRDREALQRQLELGDSKEIPPKIQGNSVENPGNFHGHSSATVRDGTVPTADDDRARENAVHGFATKLAMAANAAITKRWGEQPSPIRASAGRSVEAAQALITAQVPLEFAVPVIDRLCEKARDIPKNLTFFVGQIVSDFKQPSQTAKGSRGRVPRGTPQDFQYNNPTNRPEDVKWQE